MSNGFGVDHRENEFYLMETVENELKEGIIMTDDFIRVFPNKEVAPVNRVVKAGKYQEDAQGSGGESFASILDHELLKKKEKKDGKKGQVEKLRKLEGMNQYDARANAFVYRLSTTADYRA